MRWYDRLRRRAEIAFVRRRGRPASLPTLTAFLAEPAGPRSRIGISVSGAVGGAVVRNLVKAGGLIPSANFEKLVRLSLAPGTERGGVRIVAFIASRDGSILGASMTPLRP